MISLIKKKGVNPQTKEVIYYGQWTREETIDKSALSEIMARGSTYSVGEVEGLITDFAQHICDQLLGGNAVEIQGLGTFKLRVSTSSKSKIEDVTSKGAIVNVNFTPDVNLSMRLQNKSEFKFVTTPTAAGKKDAEAETEGPGGEQIGG